MALVTGASGGLGQQCAQTLHDAGASVVVTSRQVDLLERATEAMDRATVVGGDLALPSDRARIVSAVLNTHGRVDVLVNNAGWAQSAPAEEEGLDAFEQAVAVDLVAPFDLAVRVAAAMTDGGSIVNIASVAALRAFDRYPLAGYAAAKSGLVGLTRELAAQWGLRGIRVNAVAPGWFPTRMTGHLEDAEQIAWIEARTALHRAGELEELAMVIRFLASPASSYVTGQVLAVDGGWTAF